MLKKLMARQRALKLGAGLLGASVLAVGFASPAFATASSGGNDASANYNIYQGGSNTTYLMMQQLADLFNQAPGCDLAVVSGKIQPLDYECPSTGSSLSVPITTTATGATKKKSETVDLNAATTNANIFANDPISDSSHAIKAGTVVTGINQTTNVMTISIAAKSTVADDTFTVTTTPAVGENGFTTFSQENPFNDLLIEEPALGSSNGIQELEDQNGHAASALSAGVNVAPLDVARSSRAPNLTSSSSNGDDKGLNFVAYAMDAVTWIHWTKVKGTATASSTVPNLSVPQLTAIWQNKPCTSLVDGTSEPSANWGCYGGSKNAPIALYIAQNGSGTESTWQSLLGLTANSAKFPFGGEDPNHIIFENETASILNNGDEANAIFLFSYGKFETICAPDPSFCSGSSTSTVALGKIGGIAASKTTIGAQLPGANTTGSNPQLFPGDRLLFNVYSDGSNPQINASSPASLNAVSEDGFLCKPSSSTDIDPNTGSTYRSEISKVITGQGFFPLPLMVENGQNGQQNEAAFGPYGSTSTLNTPPGIPNPAWSDGLSASDYNAANETTPAPNQDTDDSAVNGTSYTNVYFNGSSTTTQVASPSSPVGYCLTESTDGNNTN
jgi:hypothetical protein